MPVFPLSELAERLKAELHGPANLAIEGVCSLEEPHPGCIGFAENPRQAQSAPPTMAALIVSPGTAPQHPYLVCPKPRVAFAQALELFHPPQTIRPGIHPTALISPRAQVSPEAEVGPLCVVGPDSVLEAGVRLTARVVVGAGVHVGAGTHVHPGAFLDDGVQIGANGLLDPHCRLLEGTVVGANVYIGSRSVLVGCELGAGTKMDNMGFVGRGSVIGPHSLIISKSHVGERVRTGPYFLVAAISCVSDGVNLAPVTQVAGHSWVDRSWDTPKLQLAGEPAKELKQEVKERAARLRAARTYLQRRKG